MRGKAKREYMSNVTLFYGLSCQIWLYAFVANPFDLGYLGLMILFGWHFLKESVEDKRASEAKAKLDSN